MEKIAFIILFFNILTFTLLVIQAQLKFIFSFLPSSFSLPSLVVIWSP